jgi:phage tail sheath protein FI
VPEYLYPGVYVEEIDPGKSIEGVPTGTSGFLGSIRCSLGASATIAAVLVFGVLIGAVAAIAVDKRRRRARHDAPTP